MSLKPYLCCPTPPQCESSCVSIPQDKNVEWVCYGEWLPDLRLQAPHLIDAVLLDLVRRACIAFAQQSKILNRNLELELQRAVADYYPCLGQQEHIARIRMLALDGECYRAVGSACRWDFGGRSYHFQPPDTLIISPAPHEQASLLLTVEALPREDSEEVDALLYHHYYEAILNYAAAKASLIPPAADDARRHLPTHDFYPLRMRLFNAAVQRAKIEQARHHGITPQFWSFEARF